MPHPDLLRRRLLRGGLYSGALLALPGLAACGTGVATLPGARAGTALPRGRHVSWTGDIYNSRTLTWFTDGADAPTQVLEYGPLRPGMRADEIAAAPFEARASAATNATPFVSALTHRADATGLDAELGMRYRVGSEAGGWSKVAVLRPTPRGAFRFIHYGDHGRTAGSRAVSRAMRARQADFVLLAGDMSYASGSSSLGPQEVWDDWFNQIDADFAADNILMTAPGNHENEGNNGIAYRNRMAMPRSTLSPDGTFYSFDYGNVHFLISTGGAFATDGALATEIAFLEADLAQAALRRAAGEIDFIVVSQHFTIWTDQEGRAPANYTLVALQEDIFVRYGVDLLAVGHDHVYQRSHPMAFGQRNPLGYVQITSGCGGVGIRGFEPVIQDWSAKEIAELLFVEYAVEGTQMRATTYAVNETDASTRVVDEFTIARRDPVAANLAAVQPVRELARLHANPDQLAQATQARNRRLLQTHCAAPHTHA